MRINIYAQSFSPSASNRSFQNCKSSFIVFHTPKLSFVTYSFKQCHRLSSVAVHHPLFLHIRQAFHHVVHRTAIGCLQAHLILIASAIPNRIIGQTVPCVCFMYVCVVCARPTPVNCMPINSVRCLLIHNLWMHDRRTETNMKWTYYDYIFYWVWRLCISSLSVWIVWPFRVCCSRPTYEWLMAYKSFNVSFNRSHIHIDRHPYEYIMTMNYDVCITEYRSTAKCGQVLCVHFTVQHPKRGDDKILLQKSYIRANVSVVYHRFCSEGRLSVLQTAWRLIQCSNAQMHLFIIFRTDKLLANVINCEQ